MAEYMLYSRRLAFYCWFDYNNGRMFRFKDHQTDGQVVPKRYWKKVLTSVSATNKEYQWELRTREEVEQARERTPF